MDTNNLDITVSAALHEACPQFKGVAVIATVTNTPYSEALWQEIDACSQTLMATSSLDRLKRQPAIAATREAYRRCGKDPSRYRPSAEALCRRVLRHIPLYRIDTLVDLINLVSLSTGYSIGGFDADKIAGDSLYLGIGKPDEPFEGIGRGTLNIDGLPVYRDAKGGIGTPTSDHERTKLTLDSTSLLALINGYDGNTEALNAAAGMMQALLRKYAASDGGRVLYYE